MVSLDPILSLMVFVAILSIAAIGLNIHVGYTGILNFGHVAFFGTGAYTATIMTRPPPHELNVVPKYAFGLNIPMPFGFGVSLIVGALMGGLAAFIIGLASIRLKEDYLAIATFAYAMLLWVLSRTEVWLTRGPLGVFQIPRPFTESFSGTTWLAVYLAVSVFLLALVYFATEHLVNAPFGRVLKGIREDELAARSLGKNTNWFKLKSFVLGGFFTGLAGALFAHFIGTVQPNQFTPLWTFLIWAMVIIGGTASNKGAILGVFLLVGVRYTSRFLPEIPLTEQTLLLENIRWIIVGLVLILVLRYRPQGILGPKGEIVFVEEEEQ